MVISLATPKKKITKSTSPAGSDVRLPDPTTTSANEFKKSGRTRLRIMEAAIDCLCVDGYVGTSTNTVSKRAKLTRAAMLYHFPSRMALIEAVIHYVMRERIRTYVDDISPLTLEDRFKGDSIDIYWRHVKDRLFRAFAELSNAARTNPELAAILEPALAEFDRARRETALQLRPKWVTEQPYFDLRRDITRYLIEGLGQLDAPSYNASERIANMIGFLKALQSEPEEIFLRAIELAKAGAPAPKRQPPRPARPKTVRSGAS